MSAIRNWLALPVDLGRLFAGASQALLVDLRIIALGPGSHGEAQRTVRPPDLAVEEVLGWYVYLPLERTVRMPLKIC